MYVLHTYTKIQKSVRLGSDNLQNWFHVKSSAAEKILFSSLYCLLIVKTRRKAGLRPAFCSLLSLPLIAVKVWQSKVQGVTGFGTRCDKVWYKVWKSLPSKSVSGTRSDIVWYKVWQDGSGSIPSQFWVDSKSIPGRFQVDSTIPSRFRVDSKSITGRFFYSKSIPSRLRVDSSILSRFQVDSGSIPSRFWVDSTILSRLRVDSKSILLF